LRCAAAERLGCIGVPAFSVETACAGFMYALSIADKYVRCGKPSGRW
jgi:3-oxoacyl-[acyl-carrier-protein] synthase-3